MCASSLILLLRDRSDLIRLNLIRWHTFGGIVFAVAGAWFAVRHAAPALRLSSWVALGACILIWAAGVFSGFFPLLALVGYAGAVLSAVYVAQRLKAYGRFAAYTGGAVAGCLMVLLATGIILAKGLLPGSIESETTKRVYDAHRWSGLLGIFLLLGHLPAKRLGPSRSWGGIRPTLRRMVLLLSSGVFLAALGHTVTIRISEPIAVAVPDDRTILQSLDPEWCSRCHPSEYDQWSVSVHRFSAVNLPYLRVVRLIAEEKGVETTALCARCHNPLHGAFGETDPMVGSEIDRISEGGVSCAACHTMEWVHPDHVNGQYRLSAPKGYNDARVWLSNSEARRTLHEAFIRADSRPHRRDFGHFPNHSPERCMACHRVALPEMSPDTEKRTIEDVVTSWQKGVGAKDPKSCVACHLSRANVEPPGRLTAQEFHPHANHYVPGIHTAQVLTIPPGTSDLDVSRYDAFAARWIRGDLYLGNGARFIHLLHGTSEPPHYDRYIVGRPVLDVDIAGIRSVDGELRVVVDSSNSRVGHDFPSGAHDLNQVWLEVVAWNGTAGDDSDFSYSSGRLREDGSVDPGALFLGAEDLDHEGKPIQQHRILDIHAIRNVRVIAPGETRRDDLKLPWLPADSRVRVRWLYRRYNPSFAAWALGVEPNAVPIVELGAATARVP